MESATNAVNYSVTTHSASIATMHLVSYRSISIELDWPSPLSPLHLTSMELTNIFKICYCHKFDVFLFLSSARAGLLIGLCLKLNLESAWSQHANNQLFVHTI